MSIEISQFDELAVRHNAAMNAYLTIYEARNPRPQKEQVSRDIVSLIIMIALAIVMIAAVIVSSSRTIDEFGGGFIGATAFVMIEGGIMAYAFFRARRNASKTRLQNTVRWATAGLILTFIVGLGANTDASLKTRGVYLPDWISSTINILLAVSAPTLAFISSDVLAIELMATDIKRRESDAQFKVNNDTWWEGFNRSWNAQQRNWGVKVEIEKPKQLSSVSILSNGQTGHGQGFNRESKAASIVREHLTGHPEDFSIPVRQLAELLNVGKSTVSNVIRDMRSQRSDV